MKSGAIKQLLVNRGYQEVITYSFVAPNLPELLTPGIKAMVLANPISADMSVMRTTLWAGLIHTLCYNLNRQQARVRIFEQGLSPVLRGSWSPSSPIKENEAWQGDQPDQYTCRINLWQQLSGAMGGAVP